MAPSPAARAAPPECAPVPAQPARPSTKTPRSKGAAQRWLVSRQSRSTNHEVLVKTWNLIHVFVSGCFAVLEGWLALSLREKELSCGLLNSAIHKQGFGYAKQPALSESTWTHWKRLAFEHISPTPPAPHPAAGESPRTLALTQTTQTTHRRRRAHLEVFEKLAQRHVHAALRTVHHTVHSPRRCTVVGHDRVPAFAPTRARRKPRSSGLGGG